MTLKLLVLAMLLMFPSFVGRCGISSSNITGTPFERVASTKGFDDKQAIRAVIGEACSEPYRTQLAIAGAIRNRGSLQGVVGLKNNKMIDAQTKNTFAIATSAWNESATNNIVKGANHFECNRFPAPYWAQGIKPVVVVGRFKFYKLP